MPKVLNNEIFTTQFRTKQTVPHELESQNISQSSTNLTSTNGFLSLTPEDTIVMLEPTQDVNEIIDQPAKNDDTENGSQLESGTGSSDRNQDYENSSSRFYEGLHDSNTSNLSNSMVNEKIPEKSIVPEAQ